MLTVVAEILAKPGCEQRLREELLRLIEPTRAEEGCLQYDLHESTEQPGRFLFYENWTSRAALDRHLATPHLERLSALLAELAQAEPRIDTFLRIA